MNELKDLTAGEFLKQLSEIYYKDSGFKENLDQAYEEAKGNELIKDCEIEFIGGQDGLTIKFINVQK